MTTRFVLAPSAPSQASEFGAWPSVCFHGWKWSLTKTESNPTSSARREKSSNSRGPNCSAEALYPSFSTYRSCKLIHHRGTESTEDKFRIALDIGIYLDLRNESAISGSKRSKTLCSLCLCGEHQDQALARTSSRSRFMLARTSSSVLPSKLKSRSVTPTSRKARISPAIALLSPEKRRRSPSSAFSGMALPRCVTR